MKFSGSAVLISFCLANLANLTSASGAQAAEIPTLSWKESVQRAAEQNGELRSAMAAREATHNQEGVARSGFLPSLTASMGITESSGGGGGTVVGAGSSGGGASLVVTGSSNGSTTYSATLSGSQNLFNGLQDYGKVKQAKANTRAQDANVAAVKAKVSNDLKSSFEGVVYANESVKLTEEIIHRRADNLRLVELSFESGRENKGSELLSRANLEQAKYDDLQAHNARGVAKAQLARVLGFDNPEDFEIRDSVPIQEPVPVTDFKELALSTPDHLQAKAQEESANDAITVARSGFFPALNLTGTAGKQGTQFFPQTDRWSAGLTLSLPFFSGGRDFYGTRGATETWIASSNTLYNTDRQVLAKLKLAYSAYVEAVAKLKVDRGFRDATMLRAEIARSKYNNGLLSFEDWDIIENDLITRQKTYLISQRDRVTAEAAWEQAQGKGAVP